MEPVTSLSFAQAPSDRAVVTRRAITRERDFEGVASRMLLTACG